MKEGKRACHKRHRLSHQSKLCFVFNKTDTFGTE